MPPTITPSSATLKGKEIKHFTSDISCTWVSTGGSLFTDAGCTAAYVGSSRADVYLKTINKTGSYTLTGTASGATVAALTVTGKFPAVPHINHNIKPAKRGVATDDALNGARQGRIYGDGRTVYDYKLSFKNRKWSASIGLLDGPMSEVQTFWDDHFPAKQFYYEDKFRSVEALYLFDSDPDITPTSNNRCDYDVAIRGV